LLSQAVARHRPELLPLVGELVAGERRLSASEGNALREAVGQELTGSGFTADWTATDRGWALENLIDKLGHVTAVFD
jgi:hypothetical protein